MNPGISLGQVPPFFEMNEFTFQDMCRDLFEQEPEIESCEVYGTRGQCQYGIDLKAYRKNDDGVDIGQCKCYKNFSALDIKKASDDFLIYWDELWSQKNVKRFVLFIACKIDDVKCQDAVEEQRRRFKKYGIKFEAWSAAKIRNKLRSNRSIIYSYFHDPDHWAREICGEVQTPATISDVQKDQTSILVSAALTNQINILANSLTGETEQNLEMMRKAWREGRKEEAIKWTRELKLKDSWGFISSETKAKILRFEASLELDITGDLNRVKELANEARVLAPLANDARLRALIAFKEEGPESAVHILDGQNDIDSLNLKAAFLLELGSKDECQDLLNLEVIKTKSNAETYRIRALFELLTNNLQEARLNILKALELEPLWDSIIFAAGIINFFSAHSPIALKTILESGFPLPHPIEWLMVRRDEESLRQIRKASEFFDTLLSKPSVNDNERLTLEGWKLACLANDSDKQQEAIKYCRDLLRNRPTHTYAIDWSIARKYDIDLSASIIELKILMNNTPLLNNVISLVQCYFSVKLPNQAMALLNEKKQLFVEQNCERPWTFWYVHALLLNGELESAIQIINDSDYKNDPLFQTILLQKIDDSEALLKHLETSFCQTRDPNYLLECCLLMNKQRNWDYIAQHAEKLVEEVGTGDVLHLVVIGSFNAKRYELCLKLLEKYRNLFVQQKLPGSLRRIRAVCQKELGILSNAVIEAEELVKEEPTIDNIMTLLDMYASKGDLKSFAITARKLINRSGLNIDQLLYLTWWTQWEDTSLSKEFWRKAVSQKLPDKAIGSAISLGYQLGLEDEVAPLFQKMIKLGEQGRGGIRSKKITELVEFITEMNKQNQEIWDIYRQGKAPIHTIGEQLNIPLNQLYHRALLENQNNFKTLNKFPLFIRYGGRTLVSGFPKEEIHWRLNLDITAILLAAHLKILEPITTTFKTIRIPSDTIVSLISMREKLLPTQPTRLDIKKNIIRLLEQGKLEVLEWNHFLDQENNELVNDLGEDWVALLESVKSKKGYLVDFLPLRKQLSDLPVYLSEDNSQFVINCRNVIDALRQYGPLSEVEYLAAVKALGSEGKVIGNITPHESSVLVCRANTVEILAETGQLETICSRFQVQIEKSEFDRIKAELMEHEQRHQELLWLSELIDQIRKGIDEGLYQIIPITSNKFEVKKDHFGKLNTRCLLTLLSFNLQENDVLWIDDRFLSSYFYRDVAPIIGINEVLKALVCAGTLNEDLYFHKLYELRTANVCYIPIQKEEIVFYLQHANINIQDETLIETKELIALRRYVAVCLYQNEILQKPPMPKNSPNEHGESAFIFNLKHEITDTLLDIWNKEKDEKLRKAKIDWLIANLYFDNLFLPHFTNIMQPEENKLYFAALNIVSLIILVFEFKAKSSEIKALRRQYFAWLQERFLKNAFNANPYFVTTVIDALKRIIYDHFIKDSPSQSVLPFLQGFYDDLPDVIKDELKKDEDFMKSIGFTLRMEIVFRDLIFKPDEFWYAIHNAINGNVVTIKPINLDKEVTFELDNNAQNRQVCYIDPINKKKIIIDPVFELLIDSPTERENILKRNLDWFDCSKDILNKAVADIVLTEEYEARIKKADTWRQSSYSLYLKRLHEKLLKERRFLLFDLRPPSGQGLLRHFRLEPEVKPGKEFKDLINQSLTELAGEDLLLAIERLVGLPIPLPFEIISVISALSDTDGNELIKKLLKKCLSPVSKFHLVYILNCLSDRRPSYLRLANQIVKYFFSSEGQLIIDAFLSILKWVNTDFGNWVETKNWDYNIKLATVWMHTHNLYSCFASTGISAKWLHDIFDREILKWIPQETFVRASEYNLNVLHPWQINGDAILLFGLIYSFGDRGDLIDSSLRKLIESKFFMKTQTEVPFQLPVLPLMRDFSLANNSLGSFFNVNQAKLKVIIGENSEVFSSDFLKQIVEDAINKIGGNNELYYWYYLEMIIGELPCYEDLSGRLYNLLRNTEYVNFFDKDIQMALRIILFASQQANNFKEAELCQHLKEQLIKITKRISITVKDEEGESAINVDMICFSLFEVALNVSMALKEGDHVIVEFVDLFIQLINNWSLLAIKCRIVIQRLCEELPFSQSQYFWRLILRIRME